MTTKKIDVYDHLKKCSSNVHTYYFLSIFVQAMSYSIAIALEHNVLFINLNDRQMYLHTHTHTHQSHFPNIFGQAMTCSIVIALEHITIRYTKQRNKIMKFSHCPTSTLQSTIECCHLPAVSYRV